MPPTVVVTPVSLERGSRVSLGDHSKDVFAAMLLAGVYEDWHFAPPPFGMWPSMQVAFNVSRLAVGFGREQHHAAAAAGCPKGWPSVGLNWSKYDGYEDFAQLRAEVDARVGRPGSRSRPQPPPVHVARGPLASGCLTFARGVTCA